MVPNSAVKVILSLKHSELVYEMNYLSAAYLRCMKLNTHQVRINSEFKVILIRCAVTLLYELGLRVNTR